MKGDIAMLTKKKELKAKIEISLRGSVPILFQ